MRAVRGVGRRSLIAAAAALPVHGLARRAAAAPAAVERQSRALAAAEFVAADGARHRLHELQRPLILVNLWAYWCEGCLIELPGLRQMVEQVGPDSIEVVLLSHEMNWQGDLAYARRAGLAFRLWRLAPQTSDLLAAAAFHIQNDRFGLPQALVYAGRARDLVSYTEGSQDWAAPEQIGRVRAWLNATG